jgi:hypothetical protein
MGDFRNTQWAPGVAEHIEDGDRAVERLDSHCVKFDIIELNTIMQNFIPEKVPCQQKNSFVDHPALDQAIGYGRIKCQGWIRGICSCFRKDSPFGGFSIRRLGFLSLS